MGLNSGKINSKRKILLIIALVTIIAVPLVLLTSGGFRIAFSLVVLLFCPGYVLLDALFPCYLSSFFYGPRGSLALN